VTIGPHPTDYDNIAPRYDIERGGWGVSPDDIVGSFDRSVRAKVLDLGCGTGNYLAAQIEHFKERPVQWFGLDASARMLEACANKVRGQAHVMRARAEAVPFGDRSMDYMFCGWALHHFTDKDQAVSEMARVLKPSGRLQIVNIDPWTIRDWWVYRFFPQTWDEDQRRFWPLERLVTALEERGLSVNVLREVMTPDLPGVEALTRARARVTSQLAIIDDASYRAGLDRLETYVSRDPKAAVDNGASRVRVTATKQ
jgi:ubiquinone/menaquinone biosynthesis C-methylase UbiE